MSVPKKIEDAMQYEVTLTEAAPCGRRQLLPRHPHIVSGKFLKTIKDKVASCVAIKTTR